MANTDEKNTIPKGGPLDVYRHRWIYLGITLLLLLPGLYFLIANAFNPDIRAPIRLGIDFQGGSMLEYGFAQPITQSDIPRIRTIFDQHGYTGSIIQIQEPRVGINQTPVELGAPSGEPAQPETAPTTEGTPASARGAQQTPAPATREVTPAAASIEETAARTGISTIVSIRTRQLQGQDDVAIQNALRQEFGEITILQKNSIGPALARELLVNGVLALVLAYILIAGYITFRFQFDFAVCALLALVHDSLFLFGMFALFGYFFGTEVDSLFVTAVLTAVGFSVHDTIVVFDRIRENNKLYFTKKVPFVDIVNASVNQTLARSINTSITTMLPLVALYFWGGETTRDFVMAILLGIAAGTYSSIFFASILLAMWRERTNPVASAATA